MCLKYGKSQPKRAYKARAYKKKKVYDIHCCFFIVHLRLSKKTECFLLAYKASPLSSSERWEFVNFWYLTIILNDILAIIGEQLRRHRF